MTRLIFKNLLCIILGTTLITFGCKDNSSKEEKNQTSENILMDKDYVEVITTGMDFQLKDTITHGWTTFKYINNSYEPHFFIFEKMPDSIGIDNYVNELLPPFKTAFEYLNKGDVAAGMKEFEKIPAWFYKVELFGGVGLTSPKTTTESTVYLDPGTYVMECYVRMPDGTPHTFMGMLKELTVIEGKEEKPEPNSDFEISISSDEGITFVDSLKVGSYSFGVNFKDQKLYENMLGHDVNLVKVENDTLLGTLSKWLNASDMSAFRSPAPAGLTFLGGVEDLQASKKGYFKANLDKGTYILVSEIPQAAERRMFKIFNAYE
jgi:hypothetical protein